MTPVNALQFLFLGVLTLALGIPSIVVFLLLPGRALKGRFFRLVSKTYARTALFVFGVRVAVRGLKNLDPDRPYVFMPNHQSLADPAALALAIPHPLHWVLKKELTRIPVFGWTLLAAGQIPVDRTNAARARAALDGAAAGLSGNNSILIYPEGTRSRDGGLLPFKKGGFWMAFGAGFPIVPVRVRGALDVAPPGTLRVRPGTIVVEFLPPVSTAEVHAGGIPALMTRVREALDSSGTPDPG